VPELFLDSRARFGSAESARVKLDFCEDINEVKSNMCVHSDVWECSLKCEYIFGFIDVSNRLRVISNTYRFFFHAFTNY